MKTEKLFILLILFLLVAMPGMHKLMGPIPPQWFINKFQTSFFSQFSGSIKLAYIFIMLLELFTATCFLLLIVLNVINLKGVNLLFNIAFIGLQSLFICLFFGSFLVEDYDNGFMDLMYFIGILILKKIYLANSLFKVEGEK